MKKTVLTLALLVSATLLTLAFKMADDKKVMLQVSHEVKDYAVWKKGFDMGKADRDKMGVKILGVYTSVDNPNMVTIMSEVPSVEVAKKFTMDPNLKANMEKAGVISAPEIKILMKKQ